MPIYSEAAFVAFVALCYVLGQLTTPLPRTSWYAILNSIAVWVLFGHRAFLVLMALSLAYWAAITFCLRVRAKRPATLLSQILAPVLYGSVALVFIMHKSLLEPGNDFAGLPFFPSISRAALIPPIHSVIYAMQLLAFSYIVLRLIDLIRSALDGAKLLNPLAMSAYLAPFFMTPSGPVNGYSDHLRMDGEASPRATAAHFIDSTYTIVWGYFLKFVVAQLFSIFIVGVAGAWRPESIAGTAVFLLYVLIEFSGYSLIALGVGKLIGVPTPVNFNHPYLATSVGEFWNRWHMSLGAFVRRNLYTPALVAMMRRVGRRNREAAYFANIFALWLPFVFIGVWHRFTWNFLLWGVSLGAIVAGEKLFRDRILVKYKRQIDGRGWLMTPLGIGYTLTVVVVTLHIASMDFVR